jgi:hypothetical protein
MVMVKLSAKELSEITTMGLSAPDEEGLPISALPRSRLQNAKTRLQSPR